MELARTMRKTAWVLVLVWCLLLSGGTLWARNGDPTLDDLPPDANPRYGNLATDSLAVVASKFLQDPWSKTNYDPVVVVTVQNLSEYEILRVIFRVNLLCDKGTMRLISDRLIYYVSGGLEPGETAKWKLYPKPHGEWGMRNLPYDTTIEILVEKVVTANRNSPWRKEEKWNYPSRQDFGW
jgi:hypothetical protein